MSVIKEFRRAQNRPKVRFGLEAMLSGIFDEPRSDDRSTIGILKGIRINNVNPADQIHYKFMEDGYQHFEYKLDRELKDYQVLELGEEIQQPKFWPGQNIKIVKQFGDGFVGVIQEAMTGWFHSSKYDGWWYTFDNLHGSIYEDEIQPFEINESGEPAIA